MHAYMHACALPCALPCALHAHAACALPVQVTGRLKMREASHCAYSLRQQYSKLLLQYELHMQKSKGAATPSPAAAAATPPAATAAPAGSLVKQEAPVVPAAPSSGSTASAADAAGAAGTAGGGAAGMGTASTATEVLHTSTNSLSLLLQDIEEKIPWEACIVPACSMHVVCMCMCTSWRRAELHRCTEGTELRAR